MTVDTGHREFHLNESKFLRDVILYLAKFSEQLLVYTVGGLFAYYSWVLSKGESLSKQPELWNLLLTIPIMASALSFLMALSAFLKIKMIGTCLLKLETHMGQNGFG